MCIRDSSIAAALLAYRLNPLIKDYIIPSHLSEEPAYRIAADEMGLKPVLALTQVASQGEEGAAGEEEGRQPPLEPGSSRASPKPEGEEEEGEEENPQPAHRLVGDAGGGQVEGGLGVAYLEGEQIHQGGEVGLWSGEAVSYTHLDVYKRQPQEEAMANYVPAAAVIRRWRALSGITGCKGSVGGIISCV